MADIATIGAALSSLKTATDIVMFLRTSDSSLENAEMKLKMAEIVSALADARMALTDAQIEMVEKDATISSLRDAFENKDQLIRHYDAYYESDENDCPIGVAYCLRCWEGDHKKRQLIRDAQDGRMRMCTGCGQRYEGRMSAEIFPRKEEINSPKE
jgi:hypothetical protein